MQNFRRQGRMQPPKLLLIYKFRYKKGLKLGILAHEIQNTLRQVARANSKNHISLCRPTYKFRLKRARNKDFLAHQMQNFLGKRMV